MARTALACSLLLLLLAPGIALAKDGPTRLTITARHGVMTEFEDGTEAFERLRSGLEGRIPISDTAHIERLVRGTAHLGPRLVLRWHLGQGDGAAVVLREDLFPWAAGGPLLFVPPRDGAGRGAWFGLDDSLGAFLEPIGAGRSPDGGSRVAVAAVVAVVVLLGAAMARNRRRSSGVRMSEGGTR